MRDVTWVALGGVAGAVSRFLVGTWTVKHLTASFPLATLLVNVVGSFIIGFFLVWTTERVFADPRWRLLIAVGFCGGLTTYSSYAFESFKMYEQGNLKLLILNIVGNNLAALSAVLLGAVVARML